MSRPICNCGVSWAVTFDLLFFLWSVFQKHNFPINYTIRVHAFEVFRLSNISKMVTKRISIWCSSNLSPAEELLFSLQRSQVEALVLQRLWFLVNQGVLKKVGTPPSRCYVLVTDTCFTKREIKEANDKGKLMAQLVASSLTATRGSHKTSNRTHLSKMRPSRMCSAH